MTATCAPSCASAWQKRCPSPPLPPVTQPRPSGPSLLSFNANALSHRRHSHLSDTLPHHPSDPATSTVTQQLVQMVRRTTVAFLVAPSSRPLLGLIWSFSGVSRLIFGRDIQSSRHFASEHVAGREPMPVI